MIDNRYNYCCVCSNKEFDNNKEVACKLTHKKPVFKEYCDSYLYCQEEKDRLIKARKEHFNLIDYDKKSFIQKNISGYRLIELNPKKVNVLTEEQVKNDFYKLSKQELKWNLLILAAVLIVFTLIYSQFPSLVITPLIIMAIILEFLYFVYGIILSNSKTLIINEQGLYCKEEFFDWQSILFLHFEEKKVLRNMTSVYLVINRIQLYEPVKLFLGVNYITSEIEKSILFYSNISKE